MRERVSTGYQFYWRTFYCRFYCRLGELPSPQGPVSAHVLARPPACSALVESGEPARRGWGMGNAEPASLAVSLVPSNLQSKRWARVCEGGCAREVRGCDHGPEGVWAVACARCGGDPHRGAVRRSALKRKRCWDGSIVQFLQTIRPFGPRRPGGRLASRAGSARGSCEYAQHSAVRA